MNLCNIVDVGLFHPSSPIQRPHKLKNLAYNIIIIQNEQECRSCVLKYLQENNLLLELQSAFRSILFKMDNDEVKGLVFVDFCKAFDVMDHNLLLRNHYQCTVLAVGMQ